MSNLVQRTLSGAIYVAVVVASILIHPLAFAGVFLIISTLAVREWHMLLNDFKHVRWAGMILNVLLFCLGTLVFAKDVFAMVRPYGETIFLTAGVVYISLLIGTLIAELALSRNAQPAKHWGDLLSGQVMVALPFTLMTALLAIDKWLLLAVFVLLWTNDTAAYCVGSLTAKRKNGNHKMATYISPKKSWEGLVGGAIITIGATLLLAHFGWMEKIQLCSSAMANYFIAAGFGIIAVAGGTLGDLMESLIKRSIGIKDSGKFLPGHGGVLDRFDSLLLAAPLLLLYVLILYV